MTELLQKKKQPSYTKVPSLFHIPNNTNAYPSLEDDRMVQQLYYRQENERVAKNLSITVVVDGGWAWDEKEFAGLVTRFRICYCLLHLLLSLGGFDACPTYKNCDVTRIFTHEMLGQVRIRVY